MRCALAAGFAIGAVPASALTLEETIAAALAHNERAAAADERAEAAEARLARARAFFFPDLTLRGDYTRRAYETARIVEGDEGDEVVVQSRDALEATARVDQVIFDARSIPLYRQARLGRDAASFDALDEKRRLAFEAAEAFLATLGAERVRQAAEQRRTLAQQALADARARFDAGLAGSNDVTRADLERATAELAAVRAEGVESAARLHLGFLIDDTITESLDTPENLLADAVLPVSEVDSLAIGAPARRPDVAAGRYFAEALHASAQEASFRAIPDLGLTGEYQLTNEGGLNDRDWFLGLGLRWIPYDGGERGAEHDERDALADAADLDVRQDERRASLEVRTAVVALTSEQAAIDQAGAAVEAARKNSTEISELYRQGLASELELADAGVSLFEAEVDQVRARLGLALAFLDLRAALGFDPLGQEVAP
jgi:outer membrane protein TolC